MMEKDNFKIYINKTKKAVFEKNVSTIVSVMIYLTHMECMMDITCQRSKNPKNTQTYDPQLISETGNVSDAPITASQGF